jgi:hypothetical protein
MTRRRRRTHDDMAMAICFNTVRKLRQVGIRQNLRPSLQIKAGLFDQRFEPQNHQSKDSRTSGGGQASYQAKTRASESGRFINSKSELFEHALWNLLADSSRLGLQSFDVRIPFSKRVSIGEDCKCEFGSGRSRIFGFERNRPIDRLSTSGD